MRTLTKPLSIRDVYIRFFSCTKGHAVDGMQEFEAKASEVAAILKAVANERRLMLLCKLLDMGEANVGTLADAVGLSQSALSQHLTVLREQGIVAYRRESQTLHYRLEDPRAARVLATLKDIFCPELG